MKRKREVEERWKEFKKKKREDCDREKRKEEKKMGTEKREKKIGEERYRRGGGR